MFVPSTRILSSISETLAQLLDREDLPPDVAVSVRMMSLLLNQIMILEQQGEAVFKRQYLGAASLFSSMLEECHHAGVSDDIQTCIRDLEKRAVELSRYDLSGREWETGFREYLAGVEKTMMNLSDKDSTLFGRIFAGFSKQMIEWQQTFQKRQDLSSGKNVSSTAFDEITRERLQRYFDEKFPQDSVKVSNVEVIPGGFGKQTVMFQVKGRSLSGPLVIRRDMPVALVTNDCHYVEREFPLMKAVYEKGFSLAPEVLWLEQGSQEIRGSDFIVMRKAEGGVVGDYFGSYEDIPVSLVDTLARAAGELHKLPPLRELGGRIESLRDELWDKSVSDCTYNYIRSWYDYYCHADHIAFPSLLNLFNWLLDNISECDDSPCLVHGDMTLRNWLVKDGKATCLLDWEFAHIGDPCEDLACIKDGIENMVDWDHFMEEYQLAVGKSVDKERIRYHQVWWHVRNATASCIAAGHIEAGRMWDVKLAVLPYSHVPEMIGRAQSLIDKLQC